MITDITKTEMLNRTRTQVGLKDVPLPKEEAGAMHENIIKLDIYRQYWESLADFRERFQKNTRFHRGDQLSEYVTDDEGDEVMESEYISAQGKVPFKQNLIRPMLKSLEGMFRTDASKSIVVCRKPESAGLEKMLSNALQAVLDANEMREVNPRTLDYFLLSGLPVQKVGFDMIPELGRYDVVIDYIDPNYIFFNTDIQDVRGKDLRLIGQIHDIMFGKLCEHFSNSLEDEEYLRSIYHIHPSDETPNYDNLSSSRVKNIDFYVPQEIHKCRVIEVWEEKTVRAIEIHDEIDGSEAIWDDTLDNLKKLAEARYKMQRDNGIPEDEICRIHYKYVTSSKWFYKFLSPWGHVLREGETPYAHKSHPFVSAPYPLLSGEIWGVVEDVLDVQQQANRLYTLYDFILGTGVKNPLILDEASLNGQRPEDIADQYRRVGGVIILKLKDGAKIPQQLNGNMPNLGIFEMLQNYMKLMQDISGIQPAQQGQSPGAGVPASRYMQETINSGINSKDLMEFFASFQNKVNMKVLKTIMQFYKSPRYLAISGQGPDDEKLYDPEKVKGMINEFSLVIGKSSDSPVIKMFDNELLKDFALKNMIDMKMFLKHTDYSFSKPLLADIENMEEQLLQNPAMQQQVQQPQPKQ